MKSLNKRVTYLAAVLTTTALCHSTLQAQTVLDPAWRVGAVDTNKPGFLYSYFSNNNGNNTGNTIERAENDLAGLARDSAGNLLPNLGDPTVVGPAIGEAAPANPTNGVLYFEITNVINMSKVEGDAKGNFTPDELMPGVNPLESTDGQAIEFFTYLTLPVGTNIMGVNSDDGFQTTSGPNPQDIFSRVVLGQYIGGRGASDTLFTNVVLEAGTYPFRTVWENGGGDANVEWFTVQADGTTKVLVNDIANGGVPAHRALAAGVPAPPYVKVVSPTPIPRQVDQTSSSVSVALADGSTPVDDNSVVLQVDGQPAPFTKQRVGNVLSINASPATVLQLAGEPHVGLLTFKDSTGTYSRTQQWTFYNLENLILPATPVTGENFDSYPEATSFATTVPPGWTATNYTWLETGPPAGPGVWDLTSQANDPFINWVMCDTNTAYLLEDEILDNNKSQTINGIPVIDNWMSGNCLFAASDGRARRVSQGGTDLPDDYAPQIQIAVSAPFNLSTVTNPVLTWSSSVRISGNHEQDSLEYSVDNGTNWLPAIIMQNAATLFVNPDGSYDAVKMLTNVWVDVAKFPVVQDPTTRDFISAGPLGGKFGDVLKVPITAALAPFIANRNDNSLARKVEAIRLPAASRKSAVLLRFVHYGSCGWQWAVDNIAFYDIAPTTVTPNPITIGSIAVSGPDVVLNWQGGTGPYLVQGTSSLTNGSPWLDLLTTSAQSATIPRALPMTFYRIQDGAAKTVTLFKSILNGANERPNPVTTPATGIGLLSLDGTTASYWLTYKDLTSPPTNAHVHGPADTNTAAGVVFGIAPAGGLGTATSGVISGSTTVTSKQASNITAGLTYFNIHTTTNTGGEIRGQLQLVP